MKSELNIPEVVLAVHGKKSKFLTNTTPVGNGINQNQLDAVESILSGLSQAGRNGFRFSVKGPMGSGKSTVTCLLAQALGKGCQVYKHKFQVGFDGPDIIPHGDGDLRTTAVPYENVLETLEEADCEVAIFDEDHFDHKVTKPALEQVPRVMKRKGIRAVGFLGLDMNYRGEPWASTKPVIEAANLSLALAARCVNDGNPAFLTQRTITENGVSRPAYYDDPEVFVGSIKREYKESYGAMCIKCHRVLPARNR